MSNAVTPEAKSSFTSRERSNGVRARAEMWTAQLALSTEEGGRVQRVGPLPITLAACVFAAGVFARVDAYTQPPKIVKKPAGSVSSLAGADTYREYCAVCHGIGGKGNGPAAPALKTPPPDLTMLQKRNDNKFPEDQIRATIEGQRPLPSHGAADMPIWGPIFKSLEDKEVTALRIGNLLGYIQRFQVTD
jgi:mono/diheme cytochrome c family protein